MATKLPLYIQRFGLVQGIRLYRLLKRRTGNLLCVSLPDLKHPVYLRPGTSDPKVFNQLFVQGEYEGVNLTFSPKTIIDGGANIGLAAVFFAHRYPDAQILAVEPETGNVEMLRKNTAPYPTIQVIQAGIWSRSTYLNILDDPEGEGSWAFTVVETDRPTNLSVKALSVADLIRAAGWKGADLVKLDIEGSEKEVFSANTADWLPHTRALIVETHDRTKPGCSEALFAAMAPYAHRHERIGEYEVLERLIV